MRWGGAAAALLGAVLASCGGAPVHDVGAGDPDRPLYETRCGVCHGRDGSPQGPAAAAGDLGDPAWHAGRTAGEIRQVVLQGQGKMPSFEGKLTREELDRIVGYVQRLPALKSKK